MLAQNSTRDVYLPSATWYRFNSSAVTVGPASVGGVAPLTEVPVYVRPGCVVPLGPAVQHSGALPGGALEVQVYAGADGSFELIEDDGESKHYAAGATRVTALRWDDAASTLAWKVGRGAPADGQMFRELFVRRFDERGQRVSASVAIGDSGSLQV